MHITIIAVGKLKEKFWSEACAEYGKRLARYVSVNIIELNDCDPEKHGGDEKAREAEAHAIEKAMPKDLGGGERYLVCLDPKGTQLTSEEFSQFIDDRALDGCKDLVFIIGGPTGIDQGLLSQASAKLSFGKITLPHNLARVVLLEQLYRAQKISHGEPYHK